MVDEPMPVPARTKVDFQHESAQHAQLNDLVEKTLHDARFQSWRHTYDRRPMIRMFNGIGGPRMRLLPLKVLAKIGRIPHSTEGYEDDAEKLISANPEENEIFFVSHRWLHVNRPDTDENVKAKALVEFGEWRKKWIEKGFGFTPEIFFWIDWCCIDQKNPKLDLAKLPLAIACCERMVTFVADGYLDRGWCRLEQLLATRFMYADHQTVIDEHYTDQWPYCGTEICWHLEDPAQGKLSCEADRPYIRKLVTKLGHKDGAESSDGKSKASNSASGASDGGSTGDANCESALQGVTWPQTKLKALRVFDLRRQTV